MKKWYSETLQFNHRYSRVKTGTLITSFFTCFALFESPVKRLVPLFSYALPVRSSTFHPPFTPPYHGLFFTDAWLQWLGPWPPSSPPLKKKRVGSLMKSKQRLLCLPKQPSSSLSDRASNGRASNAASSRSRDDDSDHLAKLRRFQKTSLPSTTTLIVRTQGPMEVRSIFRFVGPLSPIRAIIS